VLQYPSKADCFGYRFAGKYTYTKSSYTQKEVAMPKRIMPLTDVKIAKAKPQKKPQTMFDGGGL
jgi:hypothetical protein